MTAIFIICLLLLIAYVVLMCTYMYGWHKQPEFQLPDGFKPSTSVSVIIPARNEEQNIGSCIDSVLAQNYPSHLLEIIVIDDHSEDDTVGVVNGYNSANIKCLSLVDYLEGQKVIAYKKAALAAGIAMSKGELIVATDADCIAGENWLLDIAAIYERDRPMMIAAPVIFITDNSLLQSFQLIDLMTMQGITAAAHRLKLGNMSNGANLAFSRTAFEKVKGYDGIDQLASGDDYLLMMKMSQVGKISYLKSKEAIVGTQPQPDWKGFFQQRIRWASKSGKYNDAKLTAILMVVYLFNLSFLLLLVGSLFYTKLLLLTAAMLGVKILVELVFLLPVSRFFNKRRGLLHFVYLQPLHIAYIISAGFMGMLGGYEWKGRMVR